MTDNRFPYPAGIRLPYPTFAEAKHRAEHSALFTGRTLYVNRLASSGVMKYEVSTQPMDTTFGGGTVLVVSPEELRKAARKGKA